MLKVAPFKSDLYHQCFYNKLELILDLKVSMESAVTLDEGQSFKSLLLLGRSHGSI